jgi:SnoaL-like domain
MLDTSYPHRILSVRRNPSPSKGNPVHRTPAVAAALLALAACSVERTPQEYLDPRDPAAVERSESQQELAARIETFREALVRGNHADAVAALVPAPETFVMGVDFNDGRPRYGPQGLAQALADLRLPAGAVARTPDMRVEAGAREGALGWFATHVEVMPVASGGPPRWLRVSGVLARREGDWRLLQIHFSEPRLPAPASADTAATDSAAADSAGRATAPRPPR